MLGNITDKGYGKSHEAECAKTHEDLAKHHDTHRMGQRHDQVARCDEEDADQIHLPSPKVLFG